MTDPSADSSQSPMEAVRALYTELALHPGRDFGWGKGKENARSLGYDERWLDRLPAFVWESTAAVGNPFRLGPIMPGETIVDLGCGAGADLCMPPFSSVITAARSGSTLLQLWWRRPKKLQGSLASPMWFCMLPMSRLATILKPGGRFAVVNWHR